MAEVILAVMVFGPAVLAYFLRSNGALAFLSVCVGFVLSTSVIGDLKHLLSETHLSLANDTVGIILLTLPLVVTLLVTRQSTHRRGAGFVMQVAAALAAGGLLALSAGPLLSAGSQIQITSSSSWKDVSHVQAAIIGIGGLLSMLLIWSQNFRHHKKH